MSAWAENIAARVPIQTASVARGVKSEPCAAMSKVLFNPYSVRVLFVAMKLLAAAILSFGILVCAAASIELRLDYSKTNGVIRPLHGINKGPLTGGGLVDLTARHRELAPPFTRLHDCHWPVPDVVDIHVVFPNFSTDTSKPENYDFAMTDEYIAAVRATGAEVIYR